MIAFLWGLLTLALAAPLYVFFSSRGPASFGSDLQSLSGTLFPLFGLVAFTLVWFQTMLGAFMRKLIPIIRGVYGFHRFEGTFALVFVILHPTLLFISVGLDDFLHFRFVAPEQIPYVLLGDLAFACLVTTITTALLYRRSWLIRRWRTIHLINYAIVPLAFFHSMNVGSDLYNPVLKGLWWFYLITYLGGLTYKVFWKGSARAVQRPSEPLSGPPINAGR